MPTVRGEQAAKEHAHGETTEFV